MADPTPYEVQYSFSGFQATNPSTPLPAQSVDNEFANIQTSVNETIDALKEIRREDGTLNNGVVTLDSLDATVSDALGGGAYDAQEAAEASAIAAAESEANAAASEAAAAMYASKLSGTSTSSVAIATGSKSFTTQAGKFFDVGNWVLLVSAANPANYMHGQVTTYSGTALTVNVTNIGGSGTLNDWIILLSGTRGAQGATGSPGAGTGDMLGANNLSDVANAGTARTNLALGSGDNVTHNTLLLNASTNQIQLDADATDKLTLTMAALSAPRTQTFPDKSGTFAMTSELPAAASTSTAGLVELATTAETEAGSDADKAVTPAGMFAALGVSDIFESTQQTVTLGAKLTIPHGLGVVPKIVQLDLVCVEADLGWSVGDVITIFGGVDTGSARDWNAFVAKNATNIYILQGSFSIAIPNFTSGVYFSITTSKWRWVVRAWA